MKWYWKVRLYREDDIYSTAQAITEQCLAHIDTIQDFYYELTGYKMILEGMSENPYPDLPNVRTAFDKLRIMVIK